MRAVLLDAADYERLLGLGVEGLLAALVETPYREDVQAALLRGRGLLALHRALSANLTRTLLAVRGYYQDRAGQAVSALLARWDLHNALTLLRASVRGAGADEVLSLLVPVGALDEVAARELARQPDLGGMIELMVAWGVPRPEIGWALWRALPRFERDGDLPALEAVAVHAHAAALDRALAEPTSERRLLAPLLREELDRRNLLLALRLRDARGQGESTPDDAGAFVPGGRIAPDALVALARAGKEAPERSGRLAPWPGWLEALDRWSRTGDLLELERDLERAVTLRAVALLRGEDPLGVAVPIAFVAAKDNEVRNLRLLGREAYAGTPAELVRDQLLVPW
jgi:vacuolar-type H+-ATPase subunit C/Vma6